MTNDMTPKLLRNLFLLGPFLLLIGCTTTPSRAKQAPSMVENSTPAAASQEAEPDPIIGNWTTDGNDVFVIKEDGTVDNKQHTETTNELVQACTKDGFDVSECSIPKILWKKHPTGASQYFMAFQMPLYISATEQEAGRCICIPEPGLPMIIQMTDNQLAFQTLAPSGAVIPGSGFQLQRVD